MVDGGDGAGSSIVVGLLFGDDYVGYRGACRLVRTGGRGRRPGRETLVLGGPSSVRARTRRVRGGRLLVVSTVTTVDRGSGRGRCCCGCCGGREPAAVFTDFSHERPDLFEIRVVPATGTGRPPVVLGGGRHATSTSAATLVHYGRAVGLVLLQVPVQIGLLAEAPFAQRAFERLLLVVYVAHVSLQVGRYAERSFAVVALVRLFTGVRAQVPGQVGAAREHFLTELARVPANGEKKQF